MTSPSFSYDPGLGDPISIVRFRLGDTDTSNGQVPDETIQALLDQNFTPVKVAAMCARGLSAQYARKVTKENDHTTVQYSNLAKQFTVLAQQLEAEAAREGVAAPAPGQTTPVSQMSISVSGTQRGPQDLPYPFAHGVNPYYGVWPDER